ncbi:FAD-binding oxidoreductase [Rhodoferax sp.]|uniref:NAD(P)/FAD-dependent oxidoreductase n=1 Tax=Rhodoferax sp. TaxID=50421 RepID=UPI00283EB2D7|nr:FAD-binding oxidoreductase [Rhodoferax sp.]MDR3371858.1 FAD-binding oxidoreductase [Rhodoferax sp.]
MINIETPTYYTATKKYNLNFPSLEEDIDADVVVIGGGFSGINTALELAEKGITNIVVLEGRYLGFGGTGRNGGQIMAGIGHDLEKIRKDVGEDGIRRIFEISDQGAEIIKSRIEKYNIDADFCHGYGYMGFNARQEKTLRIWEREFKSLNSRHEIRFLGGSEVKQIIGSDAYSSALLHMGGGHVHSLNLLLGEAKALASYGARIFEYSPAVEVTYGNRVTVRTAKGTVRASKLLWACDSFLNRMEPELHKTTINTYAFQMMTEPLSEELIRRISPIRGAYSDIRPVIDYYRVTNENRLLFGSATPLIEHIPGDLKAWNRQLMLKIFPYLKDVKIDLAWGGPMACSPNLFPQIGSLPNRPNVFYAQGYTGFGVTPSHIICKVLAEGMSEGSARYDLISSIKRGQVYGKDQIRPLIVTAGKVYHQVSGYWTGRR